MSTAINDIIEVGQSCGEGVHDESLVVKVRQVDKRGGSMHVDGSLLSLSGEELKLCDMFTAPAIIKTRTEEGDLAARIVHERPSGTTWFTCPKGHDKAMERPTNLKAPWEKTFQQKAAKYCNAKLCLNTSGRRSACEGQEHIIHIKTWSAIRECSVSCQAVSIQGDNITGGKLRQVCDKYLDEPSETT